MDAVFDVIIATSRLGGGANFIVCSRRGAIQAFGHVAAATIDLENAIFESWRGCLRSRWKGRSYLEREEGKGGKDAEGGVGAANRVISDCTCTCSSPSGGRDGTMSHCQ